MNLTNHILFRCATLLWVVALLVAPPLHASSPKTTAPPSPFTIVLDAGHGGHDPGALGRKGREKKINLAVTLAVGRLLEKNLRDVKVIYTRKTDVFVALDERANIANRAKADLFVSIHTNALPGKRQTRGSETYTLGMHRAADNLEVAKRENAAIIYENDYENRYEGFDPKSSESYIIFEFMQDQNMEKSVRLASLVQQQFRAAGRPDKGVHQAGFLVLRATSMPSCLIELGYITTTSEENYLISDRGVDELAQSIYQAIKKYKESQK
ncbi:MAG: N-acetylmuramoyl-L-alanine amidase [Bacteroidaceae bacterium]|nr:N-acetylmuramoyl-L-alanine amidase [Bacteroidaceae bacterium]